jgi:hypothetical protein
MPRVGFEPTTFHCDTDALSILSYRGFFAETKPSEL